MSSSTEPLAALRAVYEDIDETVNCEIISALLALPARSSPNTSNPPKPTRISSYRQISPQLIATLTQHLLGIAIDVPHSDKAQNSSSATNPSNDGLRLVIASLTAIELLLDMPIITHILDPALILSRDPVSLSILIEILAEVATIVQQLPQQTSIPTVTATPSPHKGLPAETRARISNRKLRNKIHSHHNHHSSDAYASELDNLVQELATLKRALITAKLLRDKSNNNHHHHHHNHHHKQQRMQNITNMSTSTPPTPSPTESLKNTFLLQQQEQQQEQQKQQHDIYQPTTTHDPQMLSQSSILLNEKKEMQSLKTSCEGSTSLPPPQSSLKSSTQSELPLPPSTIITTSEYQHTSDHVVENRTQSPVKTKENDTTPLTIDNIVNPIVSNTSEDHAAIITDSGSFVSEPINTDPITKSNTKDVIKPSILDDSRVDELANMLSIRMLQKLEQLITSRVAENIAAEPRVSIQSNNALVTDNTILNTQSTSKANDLPTQSITPKRVTVSEHVNEQITTNDDNKDDGDNCKPKKDIDNPCIQFTPKMISEQIQTDSPLSISEQKQPLKQLLQTPTSSKFSYQANVKKMVDVATSPATFGNTITPTVVVDKIPISNTTSLKTQSKVFKFNFDSSSDDSFTSEPGKDFDSDELKSLADNDDWPPLFISRLALKNQRKP